ncbi:hypothetical protein MMC25_002633 [Agyrium rufum]|nr:hypothetical protein [Agyrium rufum]
MAENYSNQTTVGYSASTGEDGRVRMHCTCKKFRAYGDCGDLRRRRAAIAEAEWSRQNAERQRIFSQQYAEDEAREQRRQQQSEQQYEQRQQQRQNQTQNQQQRQLAYGQSDQTVAESSSRQPVLHYEPIVYRPEDHTQQPTDHQFNQYIDTDQSQDPRQFIQDSNNHWQYRKS